MVDFRTSETELLSFRQQDHGNTEADIEPAGAVLQIVHFRLPCFACHTVAVEAPLRRGCGFIADMPQCAGNAADLYHSIGLDYFRKVQFSAQDAFNVVVARYGINLFCAGILQDLCHAFYTLGVFRFGIEHTPCFHFIHKITGMDDDIGPDLLNELFDIGVYTGAGIADM